VSEAPAINPKAVFVNAPFDGAYEPLFVTFIRICSGISRRLR